MHSISLPTLVSFGIEYFGTERISKIDSGVNCPFEQHSALGRRNAAVGDRIVQAAPRRKVRAAHQKASAASAAIVMKATTTELSVKLPRNIARAAVTS